VSRCLYHRKDPIGALQVSLQRVNYGGSSNFQIPFMIAGDGELSLTPRDRYSKIPKYTLYPQLKALENWWL